MGIDIYARWDGQTDEEREAQYCGFSIVSGHVGYLREAYHGEPYATRYLVAEAFSRPDDEEEDGVPIAAALLQERLPHTLALARQRHKVIYQEEDETIVPYLKSYEDFVELCARKEANTGKPCRIVASY